jgi:hypothetical protein
LLESHFINVLNINGFEIPVYINNNGNRYSSFRSSDGDDNQRENDLEVA